MDPIDDSLAIGVDLGATKIATALVNRAGRVLASRETPTCAAEGFAATCDRIATEVRALLDVASASHRSDSVESRAGRPYHVAGIGIGSPGLIDPACGVVRYAVNLGWNDVHLCDELEQRIGDMPVLLGKDADVNALGEGMFGSARDSRDYVLLTIGSGLGAGVVSGGKLITGASGIAADLGHFALDPDRGRPCRCGHRGCAETVVSGPGLVALFRSFKPHGCAVAPDGIVAAARRGDEIALAAMGQLARGLGHIAAVVAAVTNPDTIVIGGGLGVAAFDLLETEARREMDRRLPPAYRDNVRLRVATLPSPAVGAASLLWSRNIHGAFQENAG